VKRNRKKLIYNLWNNHRSGIVLFLFIIFSLIFILLNKTKCFIYLRGAASRYTAVFEYSAFRINRLFSSEKENRRLVLKLTELAALNQQYIFFSEENKRLRSLLKLKEHLPYNVIAADVTEMDMSGIPGYADINTGSNSGCVEDEAIIVPQGVVGRIVESGHDWSRVQLLTNPEARISARVMKTGDRGIVRWIHGDVFKMEGVLYRSSVKFGDIVVTSGVSSIFPGGLLIGRVSRVIQDQGAMFKNVFLRSSVNFQNLGIVFVVLNEKEKQR